MTSFLSREQEFIKINEHLDNMTKYAIEKPQANKPDTKFATFTKKAQSSAIRHAANMKADDTSLSKLKEKAASILPKDNLCMNGARKKVIPIPKERHGTSEEKKQFSTNPGYSVKTVSAIRTTTVKNASNIVVRYKNSTFIPSPSLVALVKEENATVRSQPTSRSSEASDCTSTARLKVNLSAEGLVKYLKSRISILQGEHETLIHEMSNQKELVEKSVERQKKVEGQRDLAYTRNNSLTEQMSKLEGQLEDTIRQLKESDAEHSETKKELETVKRQLKVANQNNVNMEKRLCRSTEELENAKNSLNQMRNAEKAVKDSVRNESDAQEKQIKVLRKKCTDLLNAYKKQLFLIDNLKRQNLCLEQARMIGFGEKEFTKVLDWQSKN